MDAIPVPDVLDCARPHLAAPNDDTSDPAAAVAQAQRVHDAFEQTCAYGETLWHRLDDVRAYLADHVGSDDQWQELFAAVTTTLCGPHGDSGYGRSEALRLQREHAAAR